jgi:putative tryptophan/tyrosine transport system substrate-binding protein
MLKNIITIILVFFLALQCSTGKRNKLIGITLLASDPPTELCKDGFMKALSDRGFSNKKNIEIIEKNAYGDFAAIPGITKKFVEEKVDLAVALSTVSLQSLIEEKASFPIVFSSVANPFLVGAGISDSLHHPSVTGVPSTAPIKETVEIIKELFPGITLLGTLYTPSEPNSEYYALIQKIEAAKNGILALQFPINDISDISTGIDRLADAGVKVIYQISDVLTASAFDSIVINANKKNIPIICNQIVEVNSGAILGLCLDFYKMGYEAGLMASDILEGKKVVSIPFKRMERMILSVNNKSAANFKVTFSDDFMRKANKIIR